MKQLKVLDVNTEIKFLVGPSICMFEQNIPCPNWRKPEINMRGAKRLVVKLLKG